MAHENIISVRVYVVVLTALIALTFLTVGISFIPLSSMWHVSLGLMIGSIKATLVALIFMHVIHSPRLTWIVIAVALLWLLILVSLTFTDYLTRGLVPGMPGH
ncbi:MAG TPA: cytochrome C oxidase subunit IV family protein [Pirellulales bacterium]|jgi:cytochrome c oxidase subunit 4